MKNSFRTKGPMKIYKPDLQQILKHSFKSLNNGSLAYCDNGTFKYYTNITQAEKKVMELQSLGYNVYRRYNSPFFIILNTTSNG